MTYMDYGLMDELKEAGFPQEGSGFVYPRSPNVADGYWYQPTLSELIEACGEGFHYLNRNIQSAGRAWFAGGERVTFDGSTPEEAVARLWLALNKKPEL